MKKKRDLAKRDACGRESHATAEIRVDHIDAEFFQGKKKRPIGSLNVIDALDALANDVTRWEEFDLSDADRVQLS